MAGLPHGLQRIALRESRLHIPIIYGIDHMHGASDVSGAAIFPHNLNLGATFNSEFARQEARATVLESTDLGHRWVFAPVLDLGANLYWPRLYETYGETRELTFIIEPDLSYPDATGRRQLEPGYFMLRVGDQQQRFRYSGVEAAANDNRTTTSPR